MILTQACSTKLTKLDSTTLPDFDPKVKAEIYYNNWIEAETELDDVYDKCDKFLIEDSK